MVVNEYIDVGWKTGPSGETWNSNSKDVWETGDRMHQGDSIKSIMSLVYTVNREIFNSNKFSRLAESTKN